MVFGRPWETKGHAHFFLRVRRCTQYICLKFGKKSNNHRRLAAGCRSIRPDGLGVSRCRFVRHGIL